MKKLDIASVAEFIQKQTPETRIYLGCDSERIKIDGTWYADYVLAIVVHINGNNGCKLFGEVHRERVWDVKPGKPAMRLRCRLLSKVTRHTMCCGTSAMHRGAPTSNTLPFFT